MVKSIRNGLSILAAALFAGAFKALPDHMTLAIWFAAAGMLALISLVVWAVAHERTFRVTRDGLGGFLRFANDLRNRPVSTVDEFLIWKADFQQWRNDVGFFLDARVSTTDKHLLDSGRFAGDLHFSARFNGEHQDLLNALLRQEANLRTITERFLSLKE